MSRLLSIFILNQVGCFSLISAICLFPFRIISKDITLMGRDGGRTIAHRPAVNLFTIYPLLAGHIRQGILQVDHSPIDVLHTSVQAL